MIVAKLSGSEDKISNHRASWVLRAVFLALALTGSGAAAEDQDKGRSNGASGDSSMQVRPADF